ncbi:hypothetical protein DW091_15435 [Eubacterium sp. AM05-23]|uniref:DUF7657 domain-containing protein n=1 Tax=Eubacterium TaxID=1730 RepID=UPI000E484ED4|nr:MULTISPECIES: hypothetical protein [Eubacterium]RHO55564.1 hypothetical protein DW091_15435 [Eubacterium sp. AM05-23]
MSLGIDFVKKNKSKIVIVVLLAIIFAFLSVQVLSNKVNSIAELFFAEFTGLFISRFILFFLLFVFLGVHWLIPLKSLYNWMFNKRYWIALVILLFMTVNQYHGSSIACFDQYIQPGQGSEFVEPVLGSPRGIRSDEWLGSTPNRLSAQYGEDAYSKYNYVMRGTQTPNMILSVNMFCNYSSLTNPFTFAVFLFGQAYGQSIMWYGTLLLTFLVSIEMCMIISRKNKLVSVMGATLIVFSGYYQWWSFASWILGAQSSVVCGYYFIQTNNKKNKILLGVGLGLSLSYFISLLYPAWQVPTSYLFLGIIVWILYENVEKIKNLDKIDWLILAGSFAFAASIVIIYLYVSKDYTHGIMNTVYPGKRISGGGGEGTINKVFWWFYNPLFVFPGKTFNNPSEAGAFMTFFPIPLILSIWYLLKEKKKDFLVIVLIIITLFLGSYVALGWPELIAKFTLMSYSTSERAVDILMFSQLYLLVAVLSRFEKQRKMPNFLAIAIIGMFLPIYIILNLEKFPEVGIPAKYIVVISFLFCIFCFGIMVEISKKMKKNIIIGITTLAFLTGIFVHPIQKGFDAIYSKPLAKEIQTIVEKDKNRKWVSVGKTIVPQQFLIACGAPTINSVNMMPNLELWNKLDPRKKYNEVYNRFAHVQVEFTYDDTFFELIGLDTFLLHLSYKDIDKAEISYIYSNGPVDSNEYVSVKELYQEGNNYIYEIID